MSELVMYLNSICTELKPSEVHGIGTFAFKDIPKGTLVFPHWEGLTGFHELDITDIELDTRILPILKKYFSVSKNIMNVFLVQNVHFTSPWRHYVNNSFNPNLSSNGISLSNIKKHTEIVRNYNDKSMVSQPTTLI
jgi:hypothetical protein